jgi:hypothetical protein
MTRKLDLAVAKNETWHALKSPEQFKFWTLKGWNEGAFKNFELDLSLIAVETTASAGQSNVTKYRRANPYVLPSGFQIWSGSRGLTPQSYKYYYVLNVQTIKDFNKYMSEIIAIDSADCSTELESYKIRRLVFFNSKAETKIEFSIHNPNKEVQDLFLHHIWDHRGRTDYQNIPIWTQQALCNNIAVEAAHCRLIEGNQIACEIKYLKQLEGVVA